MFVAVLWVEGRYFFFAFGVLGDIAGFVKRIPGFGAEHFLGGFRITQIQNKRFFLRNGR